MIPLYLSKLFQNVLNWDYVLRREVVIITHAVIFWMDIIFTNYFGDDVHRKFYHKTVYKSQWKCEGFGINIIYTFDRIIAE